MAGFGQKKKESNISSKKLLNLSEKELKEKSINSHIKGNLKEAEKGYIAYIKNGFYDADIFSNYALICEEKGEVDKAIKLYERCVSNFPNHIFSKLNLSFLYYKLNDYKKADILIEDAIELNPNLPNGYCIRGLIYKSMNKYNESKLSLEKAIKIDPNYFDALINLGLLNKDTHNYDNAEKYYLKAIELNSNSAIAHLNLGACYKEMQKIEKAILHTELAIKLDSKLENSYLNLATIYNQQCEYTKALELAKKEILINHDFHLVYQLISEIIKNVELSGEEKREILKTILNRKDISHRELFGNLNNILSNKILEKLSIFEPNLINSKEFNIFNKG